MSMTCRDDLWFDAYGKMKKSDFGDGLDFGFILSEPNPKLHFFSFIFSGLRDVFEYSFGVRLALKYEFRGYETSKIDMLKSDDFLDSVVGEKVVDLVFRQSSLFEIFKPRFSFAKHKYFFLSDFVKNHFVKLYKIEGAADKKAVKPFLAWLKNLYCLMIETEIPLTLYYRVFEWYEKSDDEVLVEIERCGLMPLFLAFQKGKRFDEYRIDEGFHHIHHLFVELIDADRFYGLSKMMRDDRYEFKEDMYGMPVFRKRDLTS
jgi:hypothetical protein